MRAEEREGNLRADALATKGTQLHDENNENMDKYKKNGIGAMHPKIHTKETRTTGRQENHKGKNMQKCRWSAAKQKE